MAETESGFMAREIDAWMKRRRTAAFRLGPWGPCRTCGGQTRSTRMDVNGTRHVVGTIHEHMLCSYEEAARGTQAMIREGVKEENAVDAGMSNCPKCHRWTVPGMASPCIANDCDWSPARSTP